MVYVIWIILLILTNENALNLLSEFDALVFLMLVLRPKLEQMWLIENGVVVSWEVGV
jgi:hypothetical protein